MKILAIGDLVGEESIKKLRSTLENIQIAENIDFTVVNGENVSQGMGMTTKDFNELCKFNIDVIIGEEIMTTFGEIIGLFLNKKIEPLQTPEQTIKQIKEQNGIVYLPHPYDEKRYKTVLNKEKQVKLKNEFDFIEIHNGRNILDEYSKKQKKHTRKTGYNTHYW